MMIVCYICTKKNIQEDDLQSPILHLFLRKVSSLGIIAFVTYLKIFVELQPPPTGVRVERNKLLNQSFFRWLPITIVSQLLSNVLQRPLKCPSPCPHFRSNSLTLSFAKSIHRLFANYSYYLV